MVTPDYDCKLTCDNAIDNHFIFLKLTNGYLYPLCKIYQFSGYLYFEFSNIPVMYLFPFHNRLLMSDELFHIGASDLSIAFIVAAPEMDCSAIKFFEQTYFHWAACTMI